MKERKPCMLAIYVLIFYFHHTVRIIEIKCTPGTESHMESRQERRQKKAGKLERRILYFKGKKKKSSFQKYQFSILM